MHNKKESAFVLGVICITLSPFLVSFSEDLHGYLRSDVKNLLQPHHGVVVLVEDGDGLPAVLGDQVNECFYIPTEEIFHD